LPPINYETLYQLGKVGNNLNQQVKAFNTALKTGIDMPGVLESLETVNEVAGKLISQQPAGGKPRESKKSFMNLRRERGIIHQTSL